MKDFQYSVKTKSPAICSFDCCGSKFGRIEARGHDKDRRNHRENRIIRARRYAKHVIRQLVRKEIMEELYG